MDTLKAAGRVPRFLSPRICYLSRDSHLPSFIPDPLFDSIGSVNKAT